MRLVEYNEALERLRYEPDRDLSSAAPAGIRFMLPAALRESVQLILTNCIRPWSRRRTRRFTAPIRLHLGCGGTHLETWVNIDLIGVPGVDLPWDLRRRLPFPDGSVEGVFHEHLLEHLPLAAALPLLRECRRVLRRGGVLRVGVPDAERYIRDYVQPNGFIQNVRPNRPTPLLAFAEAAYCFGHASLWDGQTLCLAMTEAGFQQVSVRPFGDSSLTPAPDGRSRAAESVYAEGVNA